ncbi:hypothetical protein AU381_23480 [Sinorhizobium glycinis]|uniref:Uncharacterized protein n=1 Tax=Sinorhizobium glycinis TaxID=1472378 RepID=A0A178XTF5_9HYPH|nr:hypothetical protein [Sinorhizobium glycinis]OAP38521.1 hypothetical protein AU381_23480 [Sinorhizobium glycinis]
MSSNTSITLFMSTRELTTGYSTTPDGEKPTPDLFKRINEWLACRALKPLALLTGKSFDTTTIDISGFAGSLPSNLLIASGGYRNLGLDLLPKLHRFICSLPWVESKAVVLITCHDGDPAQVFRPSPMDSRGSPGTEVQQDQSSTTTIALMMSNYEVSADTIHDRSEPFHPPYLMQIVNQWLVDHDERPLSLLGGYSADIENWRMDGFGGSARPFLQVASGGYRELDESLLEQLQDFVTELPWRYPEVATLVLRKDGHPAAVHRPCESD